ncbi:MAG: DUF1464 domain-containing protein [Candidatus Lokiarchaeota archaeon]|nr:DUF1464 domain-containing protein [Candidatus Lokiarchaeota archaeon]MBD3342988.1 DUF1464 domain-containing protein [Candidatus Lokiarchaeota archaeon]
MSRVIGIDPGSGSWDFYGLDDNKVILDTSIPSKLITQDSSKAIDIIKSVKNVDLITAPSGFGLPLKKVEDLTEEDIFYTLLKFEKEEKSKLIGLGKVLRLFKKEKLSGVIIPGIKHLPTVPRYRKINKIDMGTADKLCTAVTGIKDQMEQYDVGPERTNFIMVEIGYGFTAVLAVENGQIIDGIGGSNIMGFRACGSLDGELAYLIKNVKKKNIYKGGVAFISGYSDLSIKEITLLAEKDKQSKTALDAYMSSVKKAVFGIASSYSNRNKIKEILLAGRGANIKFIREMMIDKLSRLSSTRLMKNYSQIAKRAAQGAAYIANGLMEGHYEPIISNLKIKEASGSILDDIYIPFDKKNLQ